MRVWLSNMKYNGYKLPLFVQVTKKGLLSTYCVSLTLATGDLQLKRPLAQAGNLLSEYYFNVKSDICIVFLFYIYSHIMDYL